MTLPIRALANRYPGLTCYVAGIEQDAEYYEIARARFGVARQPVLV